MLRALEDPRQEVELRTKIIPIVKVLWRNHTLEEATWEMEFDMNEKYQNCLNE